MPRFLDRYTNIALHSAERYPRSNVEVQCMGLSGGRNAEMRAMTIAAFRIAQDNTQLSQQCMNADLLEFLVANSTSVINHWLRATRLERYGETYELTSAGLAECQNTLLGLSGNYNTSELKVQAWLNRMLNGDRAACRRRTFEPQCWPRR